VRFGQKNFVRAALTVREVTSYHGTLEFHFFEASDEKSSIA
jgi:hypothetical protein